MPYDPTILQGLKPIQIEDPMQKYANFLAIKGAQNQLSEYNRQMKERDVLNQSLVLNPDGTVNYPESSRNYLAAGLGSQIPTLEKQRLETEAASLEAEGKKSNLVIQKSKLLDEKIARSNALLATVNNKAGLINWMTGNFKDEDLAKYYEAQHPYEDWINIFETAAQMNPEGFQQMLNRFKYGKEADEYTTNTVNTGLESVIQRTPKLGTGATTEVPGSRIPLVPSNNVIEENLGNVSRIGVIPEKGTPTYTEISRKPIGRSPNVPTQTINVDAKTSVKYGETLATEVAKKDMALDDSAFAAHNQNLELEPILDMVEGNAPLITGAGSDFRLGLEKWASLIGGIDPTTIKNTEQLAAFLAKNTLDSIKTLGIGARGLDTPAERKFLETFSGKPNLDRKTIAEVLRTIHRINGRLIAKRNARMKTMPQDAVKTLNFDTTPIQFTPRKAFTPAKSQYVGLDSLPKNTRNAIISDLLSDPSGAKEFDERFGPGEAAKILKVNDPGTRGPR